MIGRWWVLAAPALLLAAVACGGAGLGGDDVASDGPHTGDDGARTDLAAGELEVRIVASRTSGNAPLTVHFEAEVEGCDSDADYLWTFGPGTYSSKKDPGDFVFHSAGTYNVKLDVHCASTGAVGSGQVQIVVLDSAELSLSAVHLTSPTTVAPGDTLEFTFDLLNRGDRIEEAFRVLIVLSKDELYQADQDTVIKEIQVEGMEDGRFAVATVPFVNEPAPLPPGLAEGAYFLFVVADPDNIVSEGNEDDNVEQATSFITVQQEAKDRADLTVTPPDFPQGAKVAAGKALGYSITLDNVGKKPAKNFKYAVFASIDASLSPDDVRLTPEQGATIFNLEPGKPVTVSAVLAIPKTMPAGSYSAIARVDLDDAIAEEDESNNVAVSPWTFEVVHEEVTGFDVRVLSVDASPHDTYWGGSLKVVVQVENGGSKASPKYPLVFFVSTEPSINTKYDPRLQTVLADPVLPGQPTTVTAVVPVPSGPSLKPGDYYLSAVIDPDATLDDLDKSNNWKLDPEPIHVFQEAFVDVGLSGAIVHPAVVEAGKEIKVGYTITNTGSTESGAFVNFIVLSPDKTVSLADVSARKDFVIGEVSIDPVAPAAVVERVDKVPVPLALPHEIGQYWVGVIGDARGHLTVDGNKANHVVVTADPITVLGPQGGCFEDDHEPNGGPETATPLVEGTTTGLGLCGGEDWFAVPLSAGQSLVVRMVAESPLYLESRPTELDLSVSDPDGKVLDASEASGPEDRVAALAVPEGGDYLVRVFPRTAGNQAHYSLDVAVLDVLDGVDLTPTHVHAIPDAIFPGGLISLAATVVNLGAEEAPASRARVALGQGTTPAAGDIPVAEIDVPAVPGASTVKVTAPVQLPKEVAGGKWHVILSLDSTALIEEVDEDNNTGASGPIEIDETMVCEDDEYDPNESPEVATVLDAGAHQGLSVCPDLPDVYAIDLPVGVSFAASVTYDQKPSKGWVAVDVIDPTMTAVLDSAPTSAAPIAGIPCVFVPGRYYVRVRVNPIAGKAGPYDYALALNVASPLPGDTCSGDRAEPNNDFVGAAPIGCGVNHLTLCKKDKDFFRISVAKGAALSLALEQAKGELKMGLYLDPKAAPAKTVSGNAGIDWVAPEDATVWVVVEPKSTALTDFRYRLTVDGVPGMDLAASDLVLEPPEVWQGEDVLMTFRLMNACQDPAPSASYTAFLSTNPGLDDSDIPILTGSVSGGVPGKEDVELAVKAMVPLDTEPGAWYVLVQADPDDALAESQEDNNVTSAGLTVGLVCVNDPLEPDDEPGMAAGIGPGTYHGLAVCPYDADWYRLVVGEGKTLFVSMSADVEAGDLDLRLYGPGDPTKPVAVSATQADVESLSYAVPAGGAGEYLIRVNGFQGAWNNYSLEVRVE